MTEDDAKLYAQDFTQEQKDRIVVLALVANSKRNREGACKPARRLYSYVRELVSERLKAHREALRGRAA